MAGATRSSDDQPISDINVTPLVDVMLVLLVLLMVTTSVVVSQSLPLDLPEASTGARSETPFVVGLERDGTLYLDDQPVTEDGLRAAARSARRKGTARASIFADGAVPHRRVIFVLDLLRQEHIDRFAIQVRPADPN